MPSIADVKKAAERIDECLDKAFSEDVEPQTSDLETLLEFALSVLNAPGLSAERLAEIQRKHSATTQEEWRYDPAENDVFCKHQGSEQTIAEIPRNEWADWDVSQKDVERVANGMFIADAHKSVPELLTEVLRLRAEKATAPTYPDCVAYRKLRVHCVDPMEAVRQVGLTMDDVIEIGTDGTHRHYWYIKIKATGQRWKELQQELDQAFPKGAVPPQ